MTDGSLNSDSRQAEKWIADELKTEKGNTMSESTTTPATEAADTPKSTPAQTVTVDIPRSRELRCMTF